MTAVEETSHAISARNQSRQQQPARDNEDHRYVPFESVCLPAQSHTTHGLASDVERAVRGDGEAAARVVAATRRGEPAWQAAVATSCLLRCAEDAHRWSEPAGWPRLCESLRLLEEIVSPRAVSHVAVCEEGIGNLTEHYFLSEEEAREQTAQYWHSWVLYRLCTAGPRDTREWVELDRGGIGLMVGAATTIRNHVLHKLQSMEAPASSYEPPSPAAWDADDSESARGRLQPHHMAMLEQIADAASLTSLPAMHCRQRAARLASLLSPALPVVEGMAVPAAEPHWAVCVGYPVATHA